jgi:periplasmic protein TonB
MKVLALSLALIGALSVAGLAQGNQETVYKPGDGVSLPQIIKEVKAKYPRPPGPDSPRGTVVMECVVARDGRPTDITVVQTLDPEIDEAAIAALKQWEFKPGEKDGKPVAVRVSVEMRFTVK